MHIPDGFINGTTSLGAATAAAGGLGVTLKVTARRLEDRALPLAGLVASFVFVLQMINFPIGAGTSAHLLGGALAAILVGPWLGAVAVGVVVITQALLFADGGVSALGLNVLNVSLIGVGVGWLTFAGIRILMPHRPGSLPVASFFAGFVSVVAASVAFALEYASGGTAGVDVSTVLAAMVGIHALVGVGEGFITAAVVGAVLAVRSDLVYGGRGMDIPAGTRPALSRRQVWGLTATGLAVAATLALFVAPMASGDPDGLERVALDRGFAATADDHALNGSPLAGYSVEGVESEAIGTGLSGLIGIGATFALGTILFVGYRVASRRRTRAAPA